MWTIIVAAVVAALIVHASKLPNWTILPIVPAVIVTWWVCLWVFKVTLAVMVPVLVIGGAIYLFLLLTKEKGKSRA